MEVCGAIGGVGVLAAFGCGSVLGSLAAARARNGRRTAFFEAGEGRSGRLAWRARNGVGWAKPAARALLRSPRLSDLAEEAVWAVELRGLRTAPEPLVSLFFALVVLVALGATLVSSSLACGAAVAACACAAALAWAGSARDRRREAAREAVPDALRAMDACFRSGLSLLQTFQQLAGEAQGPLRPLFERAAHRMEAGRGAREALGALRSGSTVPELSFVAVALDVQHQVGGSMRQVLDAARATVEGELELRRSLRVQTAQAKLSARVVSVMPFVLIAVFSLVSEGFLDPFFSSAAGLALLGLALAMQAGGIFAVRRMLAVEVD